jgi:hypothetical protein
VTAKENSNFTGSKTATFTIGVKAVSVEMIADIADQTYTGSAITPTLTVKDGETTLTLNTDYTVEYTNNVNAGTATATITGMGNYGGTASKTFTIGKATITDVTLEESSLTYTGEEQTVTVASVKAGDLVLTADDYEVSGNTGTDKGTYTVTVTAKENSNFTGSKTATFTIGVKAVSVEMIADIAYQTYTGSAITPTLTVKDGETTLTLNTDYTVEYTNNVNAGTATATITGMGNYGGTASKTFTINPKALTAEMVTLSPERFEYNGETQKPEVTVADDDLMTANDYTIENNGGKDVGTYEVVVTGKNNYTGVVTKTFEITNRTLAVGAEGDVQFAAGQTWASFYTTTENLYLPDGLMAYIVTAVNTTSATLKAINYVPKNVPVLLENNSTMTTDNSSADGNLLLGTTTSAPVSGISGMVYALHDNKLMQVTTGDIPAGRAYLVVTSSEAPQLSMIIDGGGSTAIDSLEREAENDVDVWFTLDGRKLQLQPTKKGLYIKNGKKIVVNNK